MPEQVTPSSAGDFAESALFDRLDPAELEARRLPRLSPGSGLSLARQWHRRTLERGGHPRNTVESYASDLMLFEKFVGDKPIKRVTAVDIEQFLRQAKAEASRKRRLTSLRSLFDYLVVNRKVLTANPCENLHRAPARLNVPQPLTEAEQRGLLAAANAANPRTEVTILLLLGVGLTRGELLAVRREHVTLQMPPRPVVHVVYDNPRWSGKERRLVAPARLVEAVQRLQAVAAETDLLVPLVPQSINKLVTRVARSAGITRLVTPQLLRDTFAVNQARLGLDEDGLLAVLGLANDARNRESVRRYLVLAGQAPA